GKGSAGAGSTPSPAQTAASPLPIPTVDPPPPPALTGVAFQMPSTNIHCRVLHRTFLRCDIGSGLDPKPTSGTCQFDWSAMYLEKNGSGRPGCISDTVADPSQPVLAYGNTWHRGAFTCVSRRVGLSCRNGSGGGFFLSRERWSVR